MTTVKVSHDTKAPPDAIWSLMTDMDVWVDTIEAIEKVERLDDGTEFGIGTTWRETRTMFGRTATEVMEVTELDDGARYATAAESHGSKYFSEMSVEPSAEGCRLSMSLRGEPQTLMTKVMDKTVGRLFMSSTRKALAKDLADIASAAESAQT